MKLGRILHDPALVSALPQHKFGASPPPPVLDRASVDYTPMLYHNDDYPDCTAVGYVNGARAVAALNGYQLVVNDNAALQFYSHVVGDPPDLAITGGALVTDVLAYQDAHGVDIGPQSLVARYGRVDTGSVTDLAHGMARLGFGYWGVSLRDRDMQSVGKLWDIEAGRNDGSVVGGHILLGWDYAGLALTDTVRLATWGRWQPATWGWVIARLDEAYGMTWRQLVRADGLFYSGLTADGMAAEL
jgi:hypothetical protein